ncbi:MAG: hypothetical protein JNL62_10990, partial [Bryobacterales bacterium]|nr:hypothetical protein [Bryobacterales bacterium]
MRSAEQSHGALRLYAAMTRRALLSLCPTLSIFGQKKPQPPAEIPWIQWGGPHRNFVTQSSGIKDRWPASGPRVLWKRPLGEGFSAISVDPPLLYTMYGRSGEEIVVAAEAASGKTVWKRDLVKDYGTYDITFGMGSSPRLWGDLLFIACMTK